MRKAVTWWMLLCVLAFAACARAEAGGKASANAVLATCVQVRGCAVRFVYDPPNPQASFPAIPTIFRLARRQDPRYGTWSTLVPQGLTQWISPEEMRRFLDGLEGLTLSWEVSKKPMSFRRVRLEPPPPPPQIPWKYPMSRKRGMLEIDVTSEAGSAVAFLASKKVCASLTPLAEAFRIPIAAYNYKGTLDYWDCKVPGFNLANRPESPKREPR